jgi:hypothetical protein
VKHIQKLLKQFMSEKIPYKRKTTDDTIITFIEDINKLNDNIKDMKERLKHFFEKKDYISEHKYMVKENIKKSPFDTPFKNMLIESIKIKKLLNDSLCSKYKIRKGITIQKSCASVIHELSKLICSYYNWNYQKLSKCFFENIQYVRAYENKEYAQIETKMHKFNRIIRKRELSNIQLTDNPLSNKEDILTLNKKKTISKSKSCSYYF